MAASTSTGGFNAKHSDKERSVEQNTQQSSIQFTSFAFFCRWICIYPAYINSKKSRQEGRKIRKDLCVENPTHQEIKDILLVSNLRIGIENKLYPREKSKVNIVHQINLRMHRITFYLFFRFRNFCSVAAFVSN